MFPEMAFTDARYGTLTRGDLLFVPCSGVHVFESKGASLGVRETELFSWWCMAERDGLCGSICVPFCVCDLLALVFVESCCPSVVDE